MNTSRRIALLLAWALLPAWLAAQSTFTWTGNVTTLTSGSVHARTDAAANWSGGVAPQTSDNAVLVFNSSTGLASTGDLDLQLPYSFTVQGMTLNAGMPDVYLYSDDYGTLHLGSGGLTLNGASHLLKLGSPIELTANQTWAINDGTIYSFAALSQATTGTSLTKTGTGTLALGSGDSSFSGGLNFQSGTLYLGASSSLSVANVITGPVGSGTLTLGDYTSLRTFTTGDLTLHNAITLGNQVTIGNHTSNQNITLAGAIAPTSTSTTIRSDVDGALFLQGGISNAAGGATSLKFTNAYEGSTHRLLSGSYGDDVFPVFVLSGTNSYTGATRASDAGVIFLTSGALGQTSSIIASDGYVGTGYSGGMEAILAKITSPSTTFDGALGFDTNPNTASTPTVFADNVNLAAFAPDNVPGDPTSGFWGLGSMTSATLTGTLTPPTGGNYVFGGGSGKLYVQSNLGVPSNSTGAGVRVRSSSDNNPLTVWLQGNNSFAGNLMSDHSIVVLDSATALPNNASFSLDSGAYVGYTEKFTAGGTGTANVDHTVTPAEFIARLAGSAYNSDSILGFDTTATNLPAGRTISDAINLSALNNIFIGTSTHVHLTGTLTAPNALTASSRGRLSATGINGGWLTIESPLLAANVTSLSLGANHSDQHRHGYVELTSGSSTFTGGTTLNSGYLLLGASSTVNGSGTITQGPLGTGTLRVETSSYWNTMPTLAATTSGITLHNNLNFSYGSLQFGVPFTNASDNPAYPAQSYINNGLTLNGNLTGSASTIAFSGNGTFTLNGSNSSLFASWIQIGNSLAEGSPLVVANTNSALGSTANSIYLGSGADLQFTSAAPSIGNISGGYTLGYDTNNRSYVALAAGSTLTINQTSNGTLDANIGGTPTNFSGTNTAAVNASLVKTGNATLTLAGANTYSGTTTVKGGVLLAGSNSAFGTSTIVLDGGGVGATTGIVFTNAITFGAAGGTLAGNGTIASAITAGPNVTIAPGNSPGQLTFTSNLTFASGGVASFDIANFAGSAGSGWDQIVVSSAGSFAITATTANPFTIKINSWSAAADSLGALSTDFSTAASLAILQTSAPITGLIGNGQTGTSNLVLDTSNFTTYQGGLFSLSLSGDSTALVLNFTPVPEPSTYALLALGLGFIAVAIRRQRR